MILVPWPVTDALAMVHTRAPELQTPLKGLRGLQNALTYLVIPGVSSFDATWGPVTLGTMTFPLITRGATVAL